MPEEKFNTDPSITTIAVKKRQIVMVLTLCFTVIAIVGVYTFIKKRTQANIGPAIGSANTSVTQTEPVFSVNTSTYSRENDQDMDGITDSDEEALGTSSQSFDTDNDGLSDIDETLIWKTNPTVADSDNDGFPDGSEVARGYNPAGSGRF